MPDAFKRLLLHALKGDASLFALSEEIRVALQIMDPILDGRHSRTRHHVPVTNRIVGGRLKQMSY